MVIVRLVLVRIFKFVTCNSVEYLYLISEFLTIGILTIFQFRALSDQLYRSSEYHGLVRDQIIQQVGWHFSKWIFSDSN